MKRIIIAAAFLIGAMYAATAADAPAAPDNRPTLQECQNMRDALRILGGYYQTTDKEGKATQVMYKLADLRKTLATDEHALDGVIAINDEARLKVVKEMLPDGTPPIGTPEFLKFQSSAAYKAFAAKWQTYLDAKQDIVLGRIKLDALNLGDPPDKNPISPDVINALWPMLDQ